MNVKFMSLNLCGYLSTGVPTSEGDARERSAQTPLLHKNPTVCK
jgi:hypothetical protein